MQPALTSVLEKTKMVNTLADFQLHWTSFDVFVIVIVIWTWKLNWYLRYHENDKCLDNQVWQSKLHRIIIIIIILDIKSFIIIVLHDCMTRLSTENINTA